VWKEKNISCIIINVYSSCVMSETRRLWDELLKLKKNSKEFWCLLGDFNEVRILEERRAEVNKGVGGLETREFNIFIQDKELVDTPLLGIRFTWYKPNSHCKSRLDRFLVSKELCLPHVLKNRVVDWGPKPLLEGGLCLME